MSALSHLCIEAFKWFLFGTSFSCVVKLIENAFGIILL